MIVGQHEITENVFTSNVVSHLLKLECIARCLLDLHCLHTIPETKNVLISFRELCYVINELARGQSEFLHNFPSENIHNVYIAVKLPTHQVLLVF